MPINSRRKGAAGEREAAQFLNGILGTDARRGQQRSGLDVADIVDAIPGVHLEIKRRHGVPVIWAQYAALIEVCPASAIPCLRARSSADSLARIWCIMPAGRLPDLARTTEGGTHEAEWFSSETPAGKGRDFWQWIAQAVRDAGDQIPAVMFRPDSVRRQLWAVAFPEDKTAVIAAAVFQLIRTKENTDAPK